MKILIDITCIDREPYVARVCNTKFQASSTNSAHCAVVAAVKKFLAPRGQIFDCARLHSQDTELWEHKTRYGLCVDHRFHYTYEL